MPSDVLVNIRPTNNSRGKQVTKHVTCIRRYTGVQTSSGDTASTDGLIDDDPLAEEIGGDEAPPEDLRVPVRFPEAEAVIVDRTDGVTGRAAPPPPQPRRRKGIMTGANKASNVTLEQAMARADRAARRAGQQEQRTAETNSAEIKADTRATERADTDRADTGAAAELGLNATTQGSGASDATRTPTANKRGRPTPTEDTSDSEREVIAKRDRGQGTKRGHSTTPASDADRPPRKGFRSLLPTTESSVESSSTDESMDTLNVLEESEVPTTRLQVASTLDPTRLVIKVKSLHGVPTRGSEGAACFDLRSAQSLTLEPETTTLIDTGLKLEIPTGYGLLLLSRSKLAKDGYTVEGGVIDADFRGEIKVLIHNSNRRAKQIQQGERVAQGWILKTPEIEFVEVSHGDFSETKRADQGFGSSGEI